MTPYQAKRKVSPRVTQFNRSFVFSTKSRHQVERERHRLTAVGAFSAALAAGVDSGGVRGRVKVKVEPWVGPGEVAQRWPPWRSTISREM